MNGRALLRIEVWDDLECAGGSPLAVLRDWETATEVWRLDGREELTVEMSRLDPAFSKVQEERVLRLVYEDGGAEEFDVRQPQDAKEGDGGLTVTLKCQSPRYRLGHNSELLERVEANGQVRQNFTLHGRTPADHLGRALEHAPSYFSVGTVEPTAPLTLTYELDTPLEAAQRIAEEAGAELEVERDGSSGYLVHLLTKRGAGGDTPYLRADRNVDRLRHETDSRKQATRIYPVGAGPDVAPANMAGHAFEVASVSGTDVVLAEDDGRKPIAFDDQLDGLYLEKPDGTLTQVSDTLESSQTVVLVDASGLSAGDLVRFRRDSSGAELTYLEHPVGVATYGTKADRLDRRDLPAVDNLVKNPALDTWSGGTPDGWSLIGAPTAARETSGEFVRAGEASTHLTMAEGEGLETDALPVDPSPQEPNFACRIRVYVVSGSVRLEMVDVTNGDTFPGAESGATAHTTVTGRWVEEIGIDPATVNFDDRSTSQMRLRVVAEEAAEVYLDLGQLVNRPGLSEPLFAGRASNLLWHAANDELRKRGLPAHRYELRAADLHRLDPDAYPHDELLLGSDVRLKDTDLGLDLTTRIVQLERRHREETEVRVRLSSAPDDLEGQLGARGKKRVPEPPDPPVSEGPPVADEDPSETASTATLALTVFDPQNGDLIVRFQTRTSDDDSWSSTDEQTGVANGSTVSKQVAKVEGHDAAIRYQLVGSNGVETPWKKVGFDWGFIANIEGLKAWIEDDGSGGADVDTDTDTAKVYLTWTTDGTLPPVPNPDTDDVDDTIDVAQAGRSSTKPFGVTVPKGDLLRVRGRGENHAGELAPKEATVRDKVARPGTDGEARSQPTVDVEVTSERGPVKTVQVTGTVGDDGSAQSNVELEYRRENASSWTRVASDSHSQPIAGRPGTSVTWLFRAIDTGLSPERTSDAESVNAPPFSPPTPPTGAGGHRRQRGGRETGGDPASEYSPVPQRTADGKQTVLQDGVVQETVAERSGDNAPLGDVWGKLESTGNARATFQDEQGRDIRRALAKGLYTNPDDLDGVPEGTTYNRPKATAITSGEVDLSKSGVISKLGQHIERKSGGATLDRSFAKSADTDPDDARAIPRDKDTASVEDATGKLDSVGDAEAAFQDSENRDVRRALAKGAYTDPDHLDGVPEGTTYKRPKATAINAGEVDLSKSGVISKEGQYIERKAGGKTLDTAFAKSTSTDPDDARAVPRNKDGSSVESATGKLDSGGDADADMQDSENRDIRRSLAKGAYTDPDELDGVPEGTTYKRTKATAQTSGEIDLAKSGVVSKEGQHIERQAGGQTLDRAFHRPSTSDPDDARGIPRHLGGRAEEAMATGAAAPGAGGHRRQRGGVEVGVAGREYEAREIRLADGSLPVIRDGVIQEGNTERSSDNAPLGDVWQHIAPTGQLEELMRQDDGAELRVITKGTRTITGMTDGEGHTFDPVYASAPSVEPSPGGVCYDPALDETVKWWQNIKAVNVSASGFDAKIRIQELVGATTAQQVSMSATTLQDIGSDDMDYVADKGGVDDAWDDQYVFNYDYTLSATAVGETAEITVGFYTNDGSGWVQRGTETHLQGPGRSQKNVAGEEHVIEVSGIGNHAGDEFGMGRESTGGQGGSYTGNHVAWETATDPEDRPADGGGKAPVTFVAQVAA